MAVRIRLRRIGKNPKKKPFFRISVFEETRSRDGRFIEEIGFYDPASKELRAKLNKEKYELWLKKGALPSATVKSIAKKLAK